MREITSKKFEVISIGSKTQKKLHIKMAKFVSKLITETEVTAVRSFYFDVYLHTDSKIIKVVCNFILNLVINSYFFLK